MTQAWTVGGLVLLFVALAVLVGGLVGWPYALAVLVLGAIACFSNARRNNPAALAGNPEA